MTLFLEPALLAPRARCARGAFALCSGSMLALLLATMMTAPAPVRMYHVGNSLTDGLTHAQYHEVSGRDLQWGMHVIWGTPLDYMWDHGQPNPDDDPDGSASKLYGNDDDLNAKFWKVIPNERLDVLTLQLFNRHANSDLPAVANFVSLLRENPANLGDDGRVTTRVFVFTQWQGRGEIKENDETVGWESADYGAWFGNGTYTGAWDGSFGTLDYQDKVMPLLLDPSHLGEPDPGTENDAVLTLPETAEWGKGRTLAVDHPANVLAGPIRVLPFGEAMLNLDRRLRNEAESSSIAAVEGKYGLTNTGGTRDNTGDLHFAEHLFKDGIHLNAMGQFLQALVFDAAVFGERPDLAPAADLPPRFVALAREVAWDTVAGHPYTGVAEDAPLDR